MRKRQRKKYKKQILRDLEALLLQQFPGADLTDTLADIAASLDRLLKLRSRTKISQKKQD